MFVVRFNWRRLSTAWIALLPLVSSAGEEKPRSLYDGDTVRFEQAQLIKPRQNTNFNRAFTLAPLIIQEVRDGNPPTAPSRVYFRPGSILLNGFPYEQMTYWWYYKGPKATERRSPKRRGPDVRPPKRAVPDASDPPLGVRLTLNTNGIPVIYEVLGGRGDIRQIFVTQSIEAAAIERFGPALPGRRFAAERSLNDSPQVVVPRVIDNPPAVMGPILYLQAGTHEVATLACRCMDSQAHTLAGIGYYALTPASLPERLAAPNSSLEQSLRLPRSLAASNAAD